MNAVSWRAVLDDGTIINYEDPIIVDGVTKPASIDDVDRSTLSNLLTVDTMGEVIHTLAVPKPERDKKLIVWRSFSGFSVKGEWVNIGALAGYNILNPDNTTTLKLDLVLATGITLSGDGQTVMLHPKEVFDDKTRQAIIDEQAKQDALAQADNTLLANPITEPVTEENGNSI